MTKIDALRMRIKALNGIEFTCKDVRISGEFNIHKFLGDMERNEEISFVKYKTTGGRNSKVYVEVKLKPIKEDRLPKAKREKLKKPESLWKSIWPEFFNVPNIQGTSRIVINFSE